MTTNQDRAAEVIDNVLSKDPVVYRELFGDEHVAITQDLADAGLLAPELPEPDGEWIDQWTVGDLKIEPVGHSVHLEWAEQMDDMRGMTTRNLYLDRPAVLAIFAAFARTTDATQEKK